jgi:hypothetical protein
MRCKKKANYIFKGFMSVLIFCFVLYQDKMKATEHVFQAIIYIIVFNFPYEASKGNKNASIFKVPAHPQAYLKKISPCRCLCFAS